MLNVYKTSASVVQCFTSRLLTLKMYVQKNCVAVRRRCCRS